MGDRYLALAGPARSTRDDGPSQLQGLGEELGFRRIVLPGFEAIVEGDVLDVCSDATLQGVIIGPIFRGGARRPLAALSATEAQAILASRGRMLIEQFWGSYLTLLGSGGDQAIVVRSPMGDLPCYYARRSEGTWVASDPCLLLRALNASPAFAWEEIAARLVAPNICRSPTCLTPVFELAPGNRLSIVNGSIDTLWTPWTFVDPDRRCDDREAAARLVQETVTTAIAAQASLHQRSVLLLSGGLDSSILAASLSEAGHETTALTMVTRALGGDERDYARIVAEHCGLPLHEIRREVTAIDIERSAAAELPYPTERSFSQATNGAADTIAEATNATAIFHGGGGDNVFCSLQSAAPVADLIRVSGVTRDLFPLVHDIAIFAQATHAAVVAQAMRRLAQRARHYRFATTIELLSPTCIEMSRSSLEHVWLDAPRSALPGSVSRIGILLAALSLVQSPSALARPPRRALLLAQPIVEACLRVPTWLWFERGRNRAAARRAFSTLLPETIAWRPSKGAMDSFVAEIFEANRGKIAEMLLDGQLAATGLIDRDAIARALADTGPVRGQVFGRLMHFVDVEAWLTSWASRGAR
jgi:asparagine synthase (glutamine-hydrolysing)